MTLQKRVVVFIFLMCQ